MRIASVHLQNFKRFTDLRIEGIPENAKLVLLIGSNGSGKSSVFDGFNLFSKGLSGGYKDYHPKHPSSPFSVCIVTHDGDRLELTPGGGYVVQENKKFFGRSSLRVVPVPERIRNPEQRVEQDADRPPRFTHEDRRFNADLALFTSRINRALRAPTFAGKAADTVAIFREHIEPLNRSMKRVFGENEETTIQIENYDDSDPGSPIRLDFRKGDSTFPFDLLSHGEKQIVILLMGFAVRREQMEDAVVFIDEMDLHLNTGLQKQVLREIVEHWIPDSAQLWTASHALGFIEYAQESDEAQLVDLDALDFDKPQIVSPSAKTRLDLLEIAVPRESLAKLFSNRAIVVCEGKDHGLYNAACDDSSRLFIPPGGSGNAQGVLAMARGNPGFFALRDRDFLFGSEVEAILAELPNYRILPYYSIENLLYHPENIKALEIPAFDAEGWKNEIREWATANPLLELKFERSKIQELRTIKSLERSRAWEADPKEIYDAYKSDDFETLYCVFPQKRMPLDYLGQFNLTTDRLARSPWFKAKVKELTDWSR